MQLQIITSSEFLSVSEPDIIMIPTVPEHIRELQDTIREADKREIESYGFSCAKGLWRSYKHGLMNQTAFIDGELAAIWGVGGTFMGSTGAPWLMTSEAIKKISPLKFARLYQKEVHKMLKMFPNLVNYVDADYPQAVRLLQIVGFDIGEPEKHGNGMYRKFSMNGVI